MNRREFDDILDRAVMRGNLDGSRAGVLQAVEEFADWLGQTAFSAYHQKLATLNRSGARRERKRIVQFRGAQLRAIVREELAKLLNLDAADIRHAERAAVDAFTARFEGLLATAGPGGSA